MKIVHLVAGAGGMYCGSCLQGHSLAVALRQLGEDAILIPMYTPLRTEEPEASPGRVAFGAINIFLEQKSALFRRLPRWIHRILGRPGLLRWAGRHSGSTRPEKLGGLTVSMLEGPSGRQARELQELLGWLDEIRPDAVHLSNVMLAGVARPIAERFGVPVTCSLSGEDLFLEQILPPHYERARELLRERAADLTAIAAPNHYFGNFMAEYLSAPRERIWVIPPGVEATDTERPARREGAPCTIGFFGRICPEKGLHILAEAVCRLAGFTLMPPIRLRAAGYMASADRGYLADVKKILAKRGLGDQFEYVGEVNLAGKNDFLQSLDLFSMPTVYRESKGIPVLEAWANGVPAVLPCHGAFEEMMADTGGGLLCEPNNPAALADALAILIRDPRRASETGKTAQLAVRERYSTEIMAQRYVEFFRAAIAAYPHRPSTTPDDDAATRP